MARFAGTQMSNFLGGTMNYSDISGTSIKGRSMERKATMGAEAEVANAGVQSMGKIASAGFQADAIRAQGAAQGQSSMMSGLGNLASGIAGGFAKRGSSSSGSSYGGFGGKYGSGAAPTHLPTSGWDGTYP